LTAIDARSSERALPSTLSRSYHIGWLATAVGPRGGCGRAAALIVP
jgi:hypothetical protein